MLKKVLIVAVFVVTLFGCAKTRVVKPLDSELLDPNVGICIAVMNGAPMALSKEGVEFCCSKTNQKDLCEFFKGKLGE